jgi:hypothetical protein
LTGNAIQLATRVGVWGQAGRALLATSIIAVPAAALAPRGLLFGVGVLADRSSRRCCCCCCCCRRCCCALRVPGWRVGLGAGELRLNSGASTGWRLGAASCRQLWLRNLCVQNSRQAGRRVRMAHGGNCRPGTERTHSCDCCARRVSVAIRTCAAWRAVYHQGPRNHRAHIRRQVLCA